MRWKGFWIGNGDWELGVQYRITEVAGTLESLMIDDDKLSDHIIMVCYVGVGGAKKNIIITPFLLVATGGGSRRRRTFKCTGIVYTNHDESEMKARIKSTSRRYQPKMFLSKLPPSWLSC